MPKPPKTYVGHGGQYWQINELTWGRGSTETHLKTIRPDGPAWIIPINNGVDRPTTECKWLTADGLIAALDPHIENMRYYRSSLAHKKADKNA